MIATRWDALKGPHIWSARTVGEDRLALISDTLRGQSWVNDWDEFSPIYDSVAVDEPTLEEV